jgi:hypothetical protein
MPDVIGVCMAKDEEDVIGATVGNMIRQVDHVIVADNCSSDLTRGMLDILAAESGRVTVLDDREIGYYQSRKMTELAQIAYGMGARWVVPFDADEWWCSRWGTVAEVLAECDADYGIVTAELVDHMATGVDDTDEADPVARLGWRRVEPLPLPKVACRALPHLVIEQGNHWARYSVPLRPTETPRLTVHHYPYRSADQLIRKVRNGSAAYLATTGLAPTAGLHWRQWGEFDDDQIRDLFRVWYYRDDPLARVEIDGLDLAPLIWDPPARP